jgi:prepilin-type N-terminal cleavage/methylation domain-containing protein
MIRARPDQVTRGGDAGFSLLEMLIAISILALVLAFLPGTFRLAHSTWNATAVLDQQAGRDATQRFLKNRLVEALPLFDQAKSGAVQLVFNGTSDALMFVSPSANGPQGAGLYRYSLQVRSAGTRSALVAIVAPYGPPGQATTAEEHVLFANISGGSFRYFGRNDLRQTTPAWQQEWTRRDALPDAVELSIAGGAAPQTILIELRLRSAS